MEVTDVEAVRAQLGIEQWLVSGGSWGTTLALAYAEAHPDRVSALVLAAVTTTSRAEVDWITDGVGRIFPREWEAFAEASGRRSGFTSRSHPTGGRIRATPILSSACPSLPTSSTRGR